MFLHTNLKEEYPNTVFSALCLANLRTYRLKFTYEHIVNGGPDPSDFANFCSKFVADNVATVKVEMTTKSLTR